VIPVRTEGIAELMGDVGLFCQAFGPLTDLVTADIRVSLNTSVTNNRDFGKGIDIADAILTVNGNDCPLGVCEPQTTSTGFGQGTNPSPFTPLPQYGQLTSDTTLLWRAVSLLPPRTTGFTFINVRITNIRAKAYGLTGASGNPPAILANVLISGSVPISLSSFPLTVGFGQSGLQASLSLGGMLESFRLRPSGGLYRRFQSVGISYDRLLRSQPGGRLPDTRVRREPRWRQPRDKDPDAVSEHFWWRSGVCAAPGTKWPVRNPQSIERGSGRQRWMHIPVDVSGRSAPGAAGPAQLAPGSQYAVYEVTNSNSFDIDVAEMAVDVCHGHTNDVACLALVSSQTLKNAQVRVSLAPVSTVIVADGPAPEPRFVQVGIPMDVPR